MHKKHLHKIFKNSDAHVYVAEAYRDNKPMNNVITHLIKLY